MRIRLAALAFWVGIVAAVACSGGGGGSGPLPDFSLALTPGSGAMLVNSSLGVTVSVTRLSSPSYPITITAPGLPTGVSASPLTIPATSSAGQLVLHSTVQEDALPILVQGTGGGHGHSSLYTLTARGPAGSLDTTFGSGGIALLPIGYSVRAIALQPDQKVIAAGGYKSTAAGPVVPTIMRFLRDGVIDTSYGIVIAGGSSYQLGEAEAVVIQPDGKAVVGVASAVPPAGSNSQWSLFRTDATGHFDPTFGTSDIVFHDFGATFGSANDGNSIYGLVLLPSGKLVAVGDDTDTTLNSAQGAVGRFNADGTVDTSFGTSGEVRESRVRGWFHLAVDSSGRPVTVGVLTLSCSHCGYLLGRYNTDGSADASFGASGLVMGTAGTYSSLRKVALEPDGSPIACGLGSTNGAIGFTNFVMRTTTSGALDPAFGVSGTRNLTGSGASAIVRQGSSIYIAGSLSVNGAGSVLERLGSDGNLDLSFGTAGSSSVPFGSPYTIGGPHSAILVQPDGRILIAGTMLDIQNNYYGVVVRFWP